jgi:alkylhydroperoxidase family enzyme
MERPMPRVPPATEPVDPLARTLLQKQLADHGRVTNMKRTLAHSGVALGALMNWYDLRTEAVGFLGPHATTLFVHAISTETDCLICSTFFRRALADLGEDPDTFKMDEREQALVDYGRQLARDANAVSDALFARVQQFLDDRQLVVLTAFGGLMIATNVFNNALRVDLDEYLYAFRKKEDGR